MHQADSGNYTRDQIVKPLSCGTAALTVTPPTILTHPPSLSLCSSRGEVQLFKGEPDLQAALDRRWSNAGNNQTGAALCAAPVWSWYRDSNSKPPHYESWLG